MNPVQNELQQLSVAQFQAGEMTPWNQPNPHGQYPMSPVPVDASRLCVGFGIGGFCVGTCGGFGGGFCGGFCGGIGFCGGFCNRCGGFCHHCGGFCHRCR